MKNYFKLILLFLILQTPLSNLMAQKSNEIPPLIDRELFFDNPKIAGGQLSPDGKYLSFLKAYDGTLNIWVKKINEPFENAVPLTKDKRPIPGYFWTQDGKYILYVQDKGGDENYHIYKVDPSSASKSIPDAQDLTPMEKVRAQIVMVSKKNPDIMYVGINNRDEAWHDLYELEISTGKLKMLRENKDRLVGFDFDWDEKMRLAYRSNDDGSTEILKVDGDKLSQIYSYNVLETAYSAGFTKDNKGIYLVTNVGKENDISKLCMMDLATNNITDVEKDPLNRVDFGGVSFSDNTREMLYTTYTDAKTKIYFKDKNLEKDYQYLESKFPNMEINVTSQTNDETKFLVAITSDDTPPSVYFFDRKTKELIFQYNNRPDLKTEWLCKMQPITYKSSDGLEIPAYLTLPKGVEAKNLPLIVNPHGGPWARDYWGYNPYAQFWANRGYAVLQMNFRGSTGFGKKFIDAGNGEWGQLMQDDITWGVKDLIAKGIADPKRVGITGGSYGGYATLAGLTYTPELYAAGCDIVGPSNLLTLLGSLPAYWEAGRKMMYTRTADPNTPEGLEKLKKQSPFFHADKITKPLMIIQGANDPRVKQQESDQIVCALRDLKRPVEYILATDEGHGFRKPVNNMAAMAASEKFFAKYIGGRFQESMKDDVASKLKDLTIDISSVKMPENKKFVASEKMPSPMGKVEAGKSSYSISLEVQGQKFNMEMTREISVNGDEVTIKDDVKSPMGNSSDENTWNKNTLVPIQRKTSQGPASLTLQYQNPKVSMVSNMNGKSEEYSQSIEGLYITDGGGIDQMIALVATEKMELSASTFDPMEKKVKKLQYKAAGTETIELKGVKYKCIKVIQENMDDPKDVTTMWIDTKNRVCVKMESVMPQVGYAKLLFELN